jgi:hypothetical protein
MCVEVDRPGLEYTELVLAGLTCTGQTYPIPAFAMMCWEWLDWGACTYDGIQEIAATGKIFPYPRGEDLERHTCATGTTGDLHAVNAKPRETSKIYTATTSRIQP